ncbi:Cation/calcium exchanger 4 [Bienertia sinuspersici]
MIVLLIFLYNSTSGHLRSGINGGIHQIEAKHGRIMEEIHKTSSNSTKTSLSDHEICAQVYKHKGYPNSCAYVLTHPECTSGDYLGAMAFVSIYVVYALFVAVTEIMKKKGRNLPEGVTPLLPVAANFFSSFGEGEEDSVYASLLTPENPSNPPETPSKLPHWIWNTNVAIYSDYVKASFEDGPRPVWGWNDNERYP